MVKMPKIGNEALPQRLVGHRGSRPSSHDAVSAGESKHDGSARPTTHGYYVSGGGVGVGGVPAEGAVVDPASSREDAEQ